MIFPDLLNIFQWWVTIFFIGIIFTPFTNLIFSNFIDRGYIFSKIIGIAAISYVVFVLGILKIIPFSETTIFLVSGVFLFINIFILVKVPPLQRLNLLKGSWKILIFEEVVFLSILLFWSFIRAHGPDIHGLEKYMDYGFINSILRSEYFPPLDMWLTPLSINYYYFGHLVTAVLTKLSLLPPSITFNLMLSTITAFTFTGVFSIGANLLKNFKFHPEQSRRTNFKLIVGGLLTGLITTFAGNLHTIYLFFKPYENENPLPFWNLMFSPNTFPNSYWYPNATRFIENTIHEFPIYSSVVSDLHGHFLDIPFVLLTIAVLLSLIQNSKFKILNFRFSLLTFNFSFLTLLGFILAIMYMTNAWDGIIYFLLAVFIISYLVINTTNTTNVKYYSPRYRFGEAGKYLNIGLLVVCILIGSIIFSLPFNLNFKPFASGIGIICAPTFLTDIDRFGQFLFEENHCQRSPLWQLGILYGFFYFWVISFVIFLFKKINSKHKFRISSSDAFVLILIIFSTLLIIIPEFLYVKDIYPAHYRANTMFKLVYQSFIMLSISSVYIAIRLISNIKNKIFNFYYVYLLFSILFFIFIFLYPYFAINSYFNGLRVYKGLDGIKYLKSNYPSDYESILWINENIKGQPVILEAQGDSYTDYGRVSANTGLPTVLGWTVHEWLWRGTYDIPSPRIPEITKMYESQDLEETKSLLNKYNVSLIFIGSLERQKYPSLNEEKFQGLGKIIYQKDNTKVFKIN